jgi:hypothetical protein
MYAIATTERAVAAPMDAGAARPLDGVTE